MKSPASYRADECSGRRGRIKRRTAGPVGWLLMLICGVALAPLSMMVLYGVAAQPEKADVIIVPGAGLRDGGRRLSDALKWRMDRAIELHQRGLAPKIIVTGGGKGAWNEADAMARYAKSKGVREDVILLERRARTTRENAEYSAMVMARHGLDSAIVVSQYYHVPRVRVAFTQAGVHATGCSAHRPGVLHREARFVAREALGLAAYIFRIDEWRDS